MHPVLFIGLVAFALALIFSQTLHFVRDRRRLRASETQPAATYTPLAPLPPINPSADALVLLAAYEQAVTATAQHVYVRVAPGTHEAAMHSRDAVTLQQRVRDHRNVILDRLAISRPEA